MLWRRPWAKKGPTLDVETLLGSVAERTGLESSVVAPVVFLLWRLAIVQRRLELSTEPFLRVLSASLREMGGDRWSDQDAQLWAQRQEHILRLLAPEGPLASGAKAAELLLEQQLVFCRARTLTDIRPVFDDRAERIQGLLPFHTLALTCYEGGETREIHIALDSTDVTELRHQLERGEERETP